MSSDADGPTAAMPPPVAREAAEAEAGIGADATGAVPTNVQMEKPEDINGSVSEKTDPAAATAQAQGGEPEKKPHRSTGKIAVLMSALCMAVFLAALDTTIIATALPTISAHFHSSAGYTWIGSAYLLANAASTPSWGKFSDIWGRKPVLLIANFVFFVGSLVSALSNSIGMLIVGRAIQGVGGGGLIILVNICISDLFSMRNRATYFGIVGGVWALAGALGPVIGGAFTEKVSWRWCFYINLPLDGLAFIIIFIFLDLQTPKTPLLAGLKAIDWLGSLAIIGGTLMFLLGLEFGGVTFPWSSATVVCLIVFGVVTACLFVVNEKYLASYPVMPLRLFSHRSNIAALLVCLFHGITFISGTYYLPLYFQAVRGATALLSGVYILPFALSLSICSAATGIFIRKTGRYLPPIIFGFLMMTLGVGLFIDFTRNSNWAKLIIFQLIAGVGVGPNFQSPLIALQALVPPKDIATATATFGFVRNLATAISVVIGGVVFQNGMSNHQAQLRSALPASAASQLSGGSAGANVQVVDHLRGHEQEVARTAFTESMRNMWIMYTCFSGAGLVAALFVGQYKLSKVHQETKTGLAAEEEKRREREAEKRLKAEGRGGRKSQDVSGGGADDEGLPDDEEAQKRGSSSKEDI
ncbi:MAG: hypothetical protein M1819_001863 [Sarea resinae]|nr:MAG: hypothetical protein M1819_001863 [Sarea resinae]